MRIQFWAAIFAFGVQTACALKAWDNRAPGGDGETAGPSNGTERAGAVATPPVPVGGRQQVALLYKVDAAGLVSTACSGTLIRTKNVEAHNVMISAAHCDKNMNKAYFGTTKALRGDDSNWQNAVAGLDAIDITQSVAIPENVDIAALPNCPKSMTDVRLYVLNYAVSNIEPSVVASPEVVQAAWKSAGSGPLEGTYVGFGRHVENAIEWVMDKHEQMAPLQSMDAVSLTQTDVSRGVPGRGDSGGPLFLLNSNTVIGVASCIHFTSAPAGANPAYITDYGSSAGYSRVDGVLAQIETQLRAWNPPGVVVPSKAVNGNAVVDAGP